MDALASLAVAIVIALGFYLTGQYRGGRKAREAQSKRQARTNANLTEDIADAEADVPADADDARQRLRDHARR